MSITKDRTKGHKRHPKYYIQLNQTLAAKGRTKPPRADTTKRGLTSLLKKWERFCDETALNADVQQSPPQASHFKTFLQWTLDRYPRVRAAASLDVYWLLLKMHFYEKTGHGIDDDVRRDVVNYKRYLTKEYKLRKLARTKPVMGVNDLYHILFTHWVYDDATYADERQRVQVATALLLAAYTGCRPCSLFDTSQKHLGAEEGTTGSSGDETSDDSGLGSGLSDEADPNDSDTEGGLDAISEEKGSIRYKDVSLYVLRNSIPGGPNILAAKVTLRYTKGAERRSQSSVKTFVFEGENDPMFCILDHLLSLAFHDKAFEVDSITTSVANIFRCEIPNHKNSISLRWRDDVLNKPIFRQPMRSFGVCGTSDSEPLRSGTWLRYLKRLGLNAGLEHPFTQYVIRRGLLNAVNGKAPDSVRNQMFDHASAAPTAWYLDQEVRFNTQAAFLERPSDGLVQKLARLMTLTADRNAPTRYSDKESRKIACNRVVKRLSERTRGLTAELRKKYNFVNNAPRADPAMQEKLSTDAALHTLKENLRNKYLTQDRKRYFRNADTLTLEAQFREGCNSTSVVGEAPLVGPTKYNIAERGWLVDLICDLVGDLTDKERHARRVSAITHRAALCGRQESGRRNRPAATPNCVGLSSLLEALPGDETESLQLDPEESIPLACLPTQCPICIGDERKSMSERKRQFSRPSKMMDHVDTHLVRLPPNAPVHCHHPICMAQGVVLENLRVFKNHTARVHKIALRS